ncbi:unnamed protein product [Heligmosomoides polygyrus]|uniref:DUF148 domain-containing protein n=1 Tax=Heligmosomoides polygyrus TaxID=6339 RepID=A0A183G5L4_HELPZ|nr:unnamed protein product [Heligmosomoides polygyrus]
MFAVIASCLLHTLVDAQWNVPLTNNGYSPQIAGGVQSSLPQGGFGGFYGSPFSGQPPTNQLAAQFAPQFAQFGSQYPGYGLQSVQMDPSRQFPQPQSYYGAQPMGFSPQSGAAQQYINQPGVFGTHQVAQGTFGQPSYNGQQSSGSDLFQGDDFMGSVEKPFYAIVQNPTWSAAEKSAKIEEFVASLNADAQVSALVTNPRIPEQDRLQKIQDLYAKIPDSIKREFDSKFTNL